MKTWVEKSLRRVQRGAREGRRSRLSNSCKKKQKNCIPRRNNRISPKSWRHQVRKWELCTTYGSGSPIFQNLVNLGSRLFDCVCNYFLNSIFATVTFFHNLHVLTRIVAVELLLSSFYAIAIMSWRCSRVQVFLSVWNLFLIFLTFCHLFWNTFCRPHVDEKQSLAIWVEK